MEFKCHSGIRVSIQSPIGTIAREEPKCLERIGKMLENVLASD